MSWLASNIPGLSPDIIMYRLNNDVKHYLIWQKKRSFDLEWQQVIDEEVDKLMMVRFLREAYYLGWPANIIMVKKANDKWKIYIDYTALNKDALRIVFYSRKLTSL